MSAPGNNTTVEHQQDIKLIQNPAGATPKKTQGKQGGRFFRSSTAGPHGTKGTTNKTTAVAEKEIPQEFDPNLPTTSSTLSAKEVTTKRSTTDDGGVVRRFFGRSRTGDSENSHTTAARRPSKNEKQQRRKSWKQEFFQGFLSPKTTNTVPATDSSFITNLSKGHTFELAVEVPQEDGAVVSTLTNHQISLEQYPFRLEDATVTTEAEIATRLQQMCSHMEAPKVQTLAQKLALAAQQQNLTSIVQDYLQNTLGLGDFQMALAEPREGVVTEWRQIHCRRSFYDEFHVVTTCTYQIQPANGPAQYLTAQIETPISTRPLGGHEPSLKAQVTLCALRDEPMPKAELVWFIPILDTIRLRALTLGPQAVASWNFFKNHYLPLGYATEEENSDWENVDKYNTAFLTLRGISQKSVIESQDIVDASRAVATLLESGGRIVATGNDGLNVGDASIKAGILPTANHLQEWTTQLNVGTPPPALANTIANPVAAIISRTLNLWMQNFIQGVGADYPKQFRNHVIQNHHQRYTTF